MCVCVVCVCVSVQLEQGHLLSCWHVIIYYINIFLTLNTPLNKKNFGANFSEQDDFLQIHIDLFSLSAILSN